MIAILQFFLQRKYVRIKVHKNIDSQRDKDQSFIREVTTKTDRLHRLNVLPNTNNEAGARTMRQVPLERDINIAVNGFSGFPTSTQKGLFMAMLMSRSRGTCLIHPSPVIQYE